MADISPGQKLPERNPMFEAGTGACKGFIDGLICKIIGVERNAKIGYKTDKAKAKAKKLAAHHAAHAAHRAAQNPPIAPDVPKK